MEACHSCALICLCCRYGLPEGTLVKVSCLGPAGETKIGGASEALEAAEGERAAEEVAAAASAETVEANAKVTLNYCATSKF